MNLRKHIKKLLDEHHARKVSIILEQTENIESFLEKIVETFPESENFIDFIESFIVKSKCKRIEVADFKHPALGLALHDGILFHEKIFKMSLRTFLFVLFHEISHQYQYKKYGAEKMYEVYYDEIEVSEAAKTMKYIEIIADDFAERKMRELYNLGFLQDFKPKNYGSIYKNFSLYTFENLIVQIREKLKDREVRDPQTIANTFYNMMKN